MPPGVVGPSRLPPGTPPGPLPFPFPDSVRHLRSVSAVGPDTGPETRRRSTGLYDKVPLIEDVNEKTYLTLDLMDEYVRTPL